MNEVDKLKMFEAQKRNGMERLIRNLVISIVVIIGLWYYSGTVNGWFNLPKNDIAYTLFILFPIFSIYYLINISFDIWDNYVEELKNKYGIMTEEQVKL